MCIHTSSMSFGRVHSSLFGTGRTYSALEIQINALSSDVHNTVNAMNNNGGTFIANIVYCVTTNRGFVSTKNVMYFTQVDKAKVSASVHSGFDGLFRYPIERLNLVECINELFIRLDIFPSGNWGWHIFDGKDTSCQRMMEKTRLA